MLFVWDLETSEVVYCQRTPTPVTIMMWIETYTNRDNLNLYEIIFGNGTTINKAVLSYDPTRVLWTTKLTPFTLPPGVSIIRTYTCINTTIDGSSILVGTTAGEMLVFRKDTQIFRASIPISSNGVTAITVASNGDVICGGGDGSMKKLQGNDMSWRVILECKFDAAICSLSISLNQSEILVSTVAGSIYRCLISSFNNSIVLLSHTHIITSISFNYDVNYPSTLFVTGSVNSEIRTWDISDYACQAVHKILKAGAINCVKMLRNEMVLCGSEDGFIRAFDIHTLNRQLWLIPNAHRNSVMTIDYHSSLSMQYIVSGGGDGAVRVWKLTNRDLIIQYIEHKKSVLKVFVDNKSNNLIHSIGLDGTVLTFDLKTTHRLMYHMIASGSMNDMTQRFDNEQELITCDNYGRLLHWDIDYRDPVLAVQDPSRKSLKCCTISPSGKYLAYGGEDQLLKIIDITSGLIIALGQGHSDGILTIAWTNDEQQIITSGYDNCLCVWNFYLSNLTKK